MSDVNVTYDHYDVVYMTAGFKSFERVLKYRASSQRDVHFADVVGEACTRSTGQHNSGDLTQPFGFRRACE